MVDESQLGTSSIFCGPRVIMWFTPKAGGAGGSFRRRLFAGRLGKSKFVGPAQLRCVGPRLRKRADECSNPESAKHLLVGYNGKAGQFREPSGELLPTLVPAHITLPERRSATSFPALATWRGTHEREQCAAPSPTSWITPCQPGGNVTIHSDDDAHTSAVFGLHPSQMRTATATASVRLAKPAGHHGTGMNWP